MVDQDPPSPEDLRTDAHNARRLAEIARNDRVKKVLLSAANEFLNRAAEVEAATMAVVAPLSDPTSMPDNPTG